MGRVTTHAGHRRWRSWPLVGLLLALTFFGHDLAMAAFAASAAPADQIGLEHDHDDQSAAHADGHHPDRTPEPDHPDGCAVTRFAAPRSEHDPAPPDSAVDSPAGGASVTRPASPFGGSWTGPTWPPGTHHALLQVYRI